MKRWFPPAILKLGGDWSASRLGPFLPTEVFNTMTSQMSNTIDLHLTETKRQSEQTSNTEYKQLI
jgi:hypothetical protein